MELMHRNSKHKHPSMLNEECKTIIMAFSGPKKKKKICKVCAPQMCSKNNCVLDEEAFNSKITGSSLVTKTQE